MLSSSPNMCPLYIKDTESQELSSPWRGGFCNQKTGGCIFNLHSIFHSISTKVEIPLKRGILKYTLYFYVKIPLWEKMTAVIARRKDSKENDKENSST